MQNGKIDKIKINDDQLNLEINNKKYFLKIKINLLGITEKRKSIFYFIKKQ